MSRLAKSLLFACALSASAGKAATITFACDSVGRGGQVCEEGAQAWARSTGHTVKLVPVPVSSSERLRLFQQLLAAESPLVDVYMIDIVWPGILADAFVDLKPHASATIGEHFPGIIKNNTVKGRLIGMPWFTDTGLLFYRKDLLDKYREKVPTTWDELATTARRIQNGERAKGHRQIWGYVWQGRAYEGLTCDALEWIASEGGGTIVDASGAVTIDNPAAIDAIQMASRWIGDISPRSVLHTGEEEARALFQRGDAVFMRNWPYAWAATNAAGSPVRQRVGIAALPKGRAGVSRAALGGWQLAVSRFSTQRALAIDLVLYLTGKQEQKRRALALGYNPTIASLYRDKDVLALHPYQEVLLGAVADAIPRPSTVTGRSYEKVSSDFWQMVSGVLADGKDPASSAKALQATLEARRREGQW